MNTVMSRLSPAEPTTTRRRAGVLAGLVAAVTLVLASSACTTPQGAAQDAVRQHWGGDAACAARIIQRESGWNPAAVNRYSGAKGLFQLMPSHGRWIGGELGYSWNTMGDPYKNAHAARVLSNKALSYYGDRWQPWRLDHRARRGGGCPA